ncbi:nucleotide pyrophosphohydrolase [Pseudoxanthomonas sp.]|jgi:NTP pyrophosphatase (non-canonical NTP hydrolase)|uniref:nucleotide pyrophosphohydrolase n=1 Tax=Pseudoxanthomonas sp. TaxID=1871049 RepID=UPI002E118961|nr:nucleotide pyrophosphohydrolase [Pseudoxanthomonas sp.]
MGATEPASNPKDLGRQGGQVDFSDLEKAALQLNALYEQLETLRYGRVWTTQELALGFVGDVGDLAKLIQAEAGVRTIDDHKAKLGHELSDCLWSILVLANKCGIDLEAEFVRNTREIAAHVAGELEGHTSTG